MWGLLCRPGARWASCWACLTFQTRLLLAPARDGAPKPNPHLGHCSFSAPFPSTLHSQEYVSPELSPTSELILG